MRTEARCLKGVAHDQYHVWTTMTNTMIPTGKKEGDTAIRQGIKEGGSKGHWKQVKMIRDNPGDTNYQEFYNSNKSLVTREEASSSSWTSQPEVSAPWGCSIVLTAAVPRQIMAQRWPSGEPTSATLALRWAIGRPWFVVSLVRTQKRHIQWTAERWLSDIPHKSCTSLPPLPRQWPRYLPLPGSTPPPQALSTAPGRGSRLVPGPARCSRAGIHYWVPVTNLGFGQGRAGRGVRGTAGFGPRATAHHCIHTGNRLTCLYWWPCQPRLPPVLPRSMPVRLPQFYPRHSLHYANLYTWWKFSCTIHRRLQAQFIILCQGFHSMQGRYCELIRLGIKENTSVPQ